MLHLYFNKNVVWGDWNDYQLANWRRKSQLHKTELERVYASTNIYFSTSQPCYQGEQEDFWQHQDNIYFSSKYCSKKQTLNCFCGQYVYIAILDGSPQTTEANLRTLLCPKVCLWWGSWMIQLGSCLPRCNTVGSMPPWLWKVSLIIILINYSGTVLESSEQADSETVPSFDNWPKFVRFIEKFW